MVDLKGRTLLGKYEIEGLLGQGGMGAVWSARHALTGRKLAIKTLSESYLADAAVVSRFGREARAASACEHPGIVEVLDLGRTEDGIPFLVMEFLEGETLARRIHRRSRLDQEELVRLGTLLLEALAAAHARGVIHRDLKPENIYVVPAPRRGEIVKILDFGISHKSDEAADKLTLTGSVLGTPHYMSPEQAEGEAELDVRVDIYAAGVVLYECAVGSVPFDAPNYNKLLRTILDQQPVSPRRRGAQISEPLECLILWAMEKDRERRIGSTRQMIEWLARADAGEMPPYVPRPSDLEMRTVTATHESDDGSRASLGSTFASGEPAPASWRPGPSSERSLDLAAPIAGGGLELDEDAIRPAAPIVAAAARSATVTGRHEVSPELSARHRAISEPPPSPRGRYVLFGALALAIVAGAGVLLRFVAQPGADDAQIHADVADPETARETVVIASEPRWVSVRVVGLPPGARMQLDGLPAASPVRVRRGGDHVLTISASGYEDRRIEFSADENQVLQAEMRPAQ